MEVLFIIILSVDKVCCLIMCCVVCLLSLLRCVFLSNSIWQGDTASEGYNKISQIKIHKNNVYAWYFYMVPWAAAKKPYASVAELSAPVWVPSQRLFALGVTSVASLS